MTTATITTIRIVCISDTHQLHDKLGPLPDGDILVHAGDFTGNGSIFWTESFAKWFTRQPHRHKVVIPGNHDSLCARSPDVVRRMFKHVTYLDEEAATICGLRFYGLPTTPTFEDWSFMADRGPAMRGHLAKIPKDTDVLVSHGPPFSIGDECGDGRRVGCGDLLDWIHLHHPRLVICGHIHHSHGVYQTGTTQIVNAAVLDERYNLAHEPIVVEL